MTPPAESPLGRICADLDIARESGSIVLAHGTPAPSVTYLALYMAFVGAAHEESVVYLDGANSFDAYLVAKMARRAGLEPRETLSRIHLSRAFTCHQMEALVLERLAGALRKLNTPIAVISGLLDTFYDEDVPFGEAHSVLKTTVAELVRLAGRGARILLACPDTHLPVGPKQRRFVNLLKKHSDKVLRSEGSNGQTGFALEKPYRKEYGLLEIPELPRHQWR